MLTIDALLLAHSAAIAHSELARTIAEAFLESAMASIKHAETARLAAAEIQAGRQPTIDPLTLIDQIRQSGQQLESAALALKSVSVIDAEFSKSPDVATVQP